MSDRQIEYLTITHSLSATFISFWKVQCNLHRNEDVLIQFLDEKAAFYTNGSAIAMKPCIKAALMMKGKLR